jgi:hypothetical protein
LKKNDLDKQATTGKAKGLPLGKENAYLKVPRRVLNALYFGKGGRERLALLYLYLMLCCNFKEGSRLVNGQDLFCRRAEYIGDYQELADQLQWPYSTVRKQMLLLEKKKLLEISRLPRGIRVYLPPSNSPKSLPHLKNN